MVWIVGVILISGIFGGIAGHLINQVRQPADPDDSATAAPGWIADIITGTVAALCVPAFLLLTQSKLMDWVWNDAQHGWLPDPNLLYLGGVCLLAAVSSRAFLQSVSSQLIRQTQELKTEQKKLKTGQEELKDSVAELGDTVDKDEKSPLPTALKQSLVADQDSESDLKSLLEGLSYAEKQVVLALASEAYTRRSLSGIMKDAKLKRSVTAETLEKLINRGLVTSGVSKRTGSLLYQLVPTGYRLSALLQGH